MYGSLPIKILRGIKYLLLQPNISCKYVKYHLSGQNTLNAALPWLSWSSIEFLNSQIKPNMHIFEWGSGGSTVYFANKKCSVVSIEHNQEWVALTTTRLQQLGHTAEIRFLPAHESNPQINAEYISTVQNGGPWDLVLVDGLEESWISRVDCIKAISSLSYKPKYIVLDDSWRTQYGVVPQILSSYKHLEFKSLGPSRPGVTQTDVYVYNDLPIS